MFGSLRFRRILSALAFMAALLVAGQNCTPPQSAKANGKSEAPFEPLPMGGDGYDGKLFINRLIGSVCADGSDVKNSVETKSYSTATVLRENCQDVPPREVNSIDYMPHNLNNLVYGNMTFDHVVTQPQTTRVTTYLCRGNETAERWRVLYGINVGPDFRDRYADMTIFRSSAGQYSMKMYLGQYTQGSRTNLERAYVSGEFPVAIDLASTLPTISGTDAQGNAFSFLGSRQANGSLAGRAVYNRPASAPPPGPDEVPSYLMEVICYPQ